MPRIVAPAVYLRDPNARTPMDTRTHRLFCESIEDAIDEVVKACGGRKAFAAEMWPSLPVREAHNRIDACLNPERREKFSPHDVMYVLKRGRDIGCDSLMAYMAGESGYRAEPVEPEDERAKLQREFAEAVREQRRLLERMERLTSVPTLAARRA